MPESTQKREREHDKQYVESVERHKKDAEYYKGLHDELKDNVRVLLERQQEYDKFMKTMMAERQSQGESLPTA